MKDNFKISKQQIAELKKDINELRQSIEHAFRRQCSTSGRKNRKHSCIQDMYDHQLDQAFIEDKLIGPKDRSRRNNLSIDNINKKPNETWEDFEKELNIRFKESLGIKEEVVIERARKV